jgi:CelD/BcsL family acetyltransferase involved in cellulose biosynthesis
MADTATLTCRVLSRMAEVEAIAAEWDALLTRSPCHSAFSSPGWFLAACRASPRLVPHVLTAQDGERLAGVLPLAVDPERREARFATDLADYNDVVATPGDEAVRELLRASLPALSGSYDRLVLGGLRRDSNLLSAEPSWRGRVTSCPYLLLPATYGEYLASRGPRFRQRLRARQARAAAAGVTACRLTPEALPPERLPELFLSLHLSRFGGRSCFDAAPAQDFVREALPDLFARGRAEVFALLAGERALAVQVCFADSHGLANWNGGFLPEAASFAPGRLLIETAIEHACATGREVYDLMRGDEGYKECWTSGVRTVETIEL